MASIGKRIKTALGSMLSKKKKARKTKRKTAKKK